MSKEEFDRKFAKIEEQPKLMDWESDFDLALIKRSTGEVLIESNVNEISLEDELLPLIADTLKAEDEELGLMFYLALTWTKRKFRHRFNADLKKIRCARCRTENNGVCDKAARHAETVKRITDLQATYTAEVQAQESSHGQ